MPRSPVPQSILHRATGRARVRINGKDHDLGNYGTAESKNRDARLIAEWRVTHVDPTPLRPQARNVSMVELLAAYWDHCVEYDGATGTRRCAANNLKPTLRDVRQLYGEIQANDFSPLKLRSLMERWVDRGHSRTSINDQAGVVKRMFKWAVSVELVDASVYHAIQTVPNLRAGRSKARGRAVAPLAP